MNINFWMSLWKITFIISIFIFILMFIWVSINGYKELKNNILKKD